MSVRAKICIGFVIGIGLGYALALATTSMSGHASVAIIELCSSEPKAGCIFKRVETTLGFDHTVTAVFFRSRREAERGEYSAARVECDPEADVNAIWKKNDFLIEVRDGACEFRGEAFPEWREHLQINSR